MKSFKKCLLDFKNFKIMSCGDASSNFQNNKLTMRIYLILIFII